MTVNRKQIREIVQTDHIARAMTERTGFPDYADIRTDTTAHRMATGRTRWTWGEAVLAIGAVMLVAAIGMAATKAIGQAAYDAAHYGEYEVLK